MRVHGLAGAFALAFALGLGPLGAARAATVSVDLVNAAGTALTGDSRNHWFNGARCACNQDANFRVTVTAVTDADQQIELCLEGKDCAALATIADPRSPDLATGRLVQVPVRVMMGSDCPENEGNSTIVAIIHESSGDPTNSTFTFRVDGSPPPAPTIAAAHGGDHAVDVDLEIPDGGVASSTSRYQVLCALAGTRTPIYAQPALPAFATAATTCPPALSGAPPDDLDPAFVCAPAADATGSSIQVDLSGSGLHNGQALDVRVVAIDASGNARASEVAENVVLAGPSGFGDVYHDAGGSARSGCQSVPGKGGAAAILVTSVLLARARRRRGAVLVGLVLLAFATPARADDIVEEQASAPKALDWTVQITVGAYRPDIDGEFASGPGPYERVFGGARPFFRASLGRSVPVAGGALGIDLGIGFMTAGADACLVNAESARPDCRMRSSTVSTRLSLVPASLSVVYRFSALADRLGVPLVPRVSAGLDATRWWESGGDVTDSGVTLGWHVAAGIGLRLDWLDPTAAHALLADFGLGHTELVFEYSRLVETGFGAAHNLGLSDGIIAGGFAFSF